MSQRQWNWKQGIGKIVNSILNIEPISIWIRKGEKTCDSHGESHEPKAPFLLKNTFEKNIRIAIAM